MLYSLILRYVGIFMLKIYFKIATQIKRFIPFIICLLYKMVQIETFDMTFYHIFNIYL